MAEEHPEDLVLRLHCQEIERLRGAPAPIPQANEALTLDLPQAPPGGPLAEEWKIFRQEVSRLLREGHRGRYAVVKVGRPITVWDTLRDAVAAARILSAQDPCLVQEILPFLRAHRVGYNRSCRD